VTDEPAGRPTASGASGAPGGGPAGAFPTLGEYTAAVQYPDLSFPTDPDLRSASPLTDLYGEPAVVSGAFGGVFRLESADRRGVWGVKCFHRDAGVRPARYRAICDRLSALDPDSDFWYVPIEYLEDGVLVSDRRWPVVKMKWINAPDLTDWLDTRLSGPAAADPGLPEALRGLAANFTDVVLRLERLGIAHGDLQHGNILVSAGRRVRLVDYDAMYVPALEGEARPVEGHQHYQHPEGFTYFGPRMDRFPARVIQLSLLALAADPGLWTRLRATGDERLILRDTDFTDPDASETFRVLAALGDPAVDRTAAQLLRDLGKAARDAEPLTPLRERLTAPGSAERAQAPTRRVVPAPGFPRVPRPDLEPWPLVEPEPEPEPRLKPLPEPEPGPEPQPEPDPEPSTRSAGRPSWADPDLFLDADRRAREAAAPEPPAAPSPLASSSLASPSPLASPSSPLREPAASSPPHDAYAPHAAGTGAARAARSPYDSAGRNAARGLSVFVGVIVIALLFVTTGLVLAAAHVPAHAVTGPLHGAWCHVPHACSSGKK
jgi:hypothetical protein